MLLGMLMTFTVATNEFIGHGKEKAEYQCKGEVPAEAARLLATPFVLRQAAAT